jgi:hypothetical protein
MNLKSAPGVLGFEPMTGSSICVVLKGKQQPETRATGIELELVLSCDGAAGCIAAS